MAHVNVLYIFKYRKNNFAKVSKNLDIDLKTILLIIKM